MDTISETMGLSSTNWTRRQKNHAARVEQLAEIPSTTDRTLGGDFKQIEQPTF